jgi:hypothetical protein
MRTEHPRHPWDRTGQDISMSFVLSVPPGTRTSGTNVPFVPFVPPSIREGREGQFVVLNERKTALPLSRRWPPEPRPGCAGSLGAVSDTLAALRRIHGLGSAICPAASHCPPSRLMRQRACTSRRPQAPENTGVKHWKRGSWCADAESGGLAGPAHRPDSTIPPPPARTRAPLRDPGGRKNGSSRRARTGPTRHVCPQFRL